MLQPRYEYTFVRFGETWMEGGKVAQEDYRHVIQEHAAEGWRLVQIFAPESGEGDEHYYELIFERPIISDSHHE
jgi:Domain of unknown function (DUF4177)